MVIFGIKMTAIKFPIEWWDLISKMSIFEFLANFFHHFSSFLHTFSVAVTLTFDPRSPNSIRSEPMQEATIWRKPRPNRCIRSAGILFSRSAGHTDRHTHTHTDKLQWKYNPSTISWRCQQETGNVIAAFNGLLEKKSVCACMCLSVCL